MSRRHGTRGFDALEAMPRFEAVGDAPRRCSPARGADSYVRRLKGSARAYGEAYLAWLRGQGAEPFAAQKLSWERRAGIRGALHDRCNVLKGSR